MKKVALCLLLCGCVDKPVFIGQGDSERDYKICRAEALRGSAGVGGVARIVEYDLQLEACMEAKGYKKQ